MRAIQTTISFWLTFSLFLAVLHPVRSQDTPKVTTLDDSNATIKYSGGWASMSAWHISYNHSAMLTRSAGSTATYRFNGTQVSVFGLQGPSENTTISTYSIDNGSPFQYTVPSDLKIIQWNIEFYSSPPLQDGEHTLIITNLNDQAWYTLDYIKVESPVGALPPSSTSSDKTPDLTPTPTPTSGDTQQTPTLTTTSTTTPTPTPTAGNTQQTSTPTARNPQQSKAWISKGVIAGIALGVSALVALLILAALLWRRRHLKSIGRDSTAYLLQPLEGGMVRGSARLEPYQVEQYASLSHIPTSTNGLNYKRTHDGVAPILSTENNVNTSHSLVNGHASDGATTQYTSEWRDDNSEIPPSGPSTSVPMSLSKLRPPYREAPSSRSTGNPPSAPVPQMPPSMRAPSCAPQITSSNHRSTDGGVRIACGPLPRTRGEEFEEIIDMATLPPAYGTYGDT